MEKSPRHASSGVSKSRYPLRRLFAWTGWIALAAGGMRVLIDYPDAIPLVVTMMCICAGLLTPSYLARFDATPVRLILGCLAPLVIIFIAGLAIIVLETLPGLLGAG